MAKVLGGNCKAYVCATALTATPATDAFPSGTYTELSKIVEVSISDSKEDADASDRTSLVDQSVPVGRKVEVEVKVHMDPADTATFVAFNNAYNAGTALTLAFSSADKTAVPVTGFVANWLIQEKSWSEPRKEVVICSFKLKVASFYGDFHDTTA